MQSPKRDPFSAPLPPALIYAAALTCGVLAALALEIYLTGAGFDPANLWENFLSSAFIVSGITAAALSRFPPPWHRYRLLRWVAAGVIVLVLEDITHSAGGSEAVAAGVNVAVRLMALCLAALMALLGAFVAVRR